MIDYKNPPPMDGSPQSMAYGAIGNCIAVALQVMSFNQLRFDDAKKAAWQGLIDALEKVNEQPDYPNSITWPTPPAGWENDPIFAPVWKQFTQQR